MAEPINFAQIDNDNTDHLCWLKRGSLDSAKNNIAYKGFADDPEEQKLAEVMLDWWATNDWHFCSNGRMRYAFYQGPHYPGKVSPISKR